jgi:hypothetical protein
MANTGNMVNASPSRKLVDAKELITCGICTSVYRHPLMLPCQHTFCFQCIVKSCRENYQDSLACALCMQLVTFPRGVITKLPKNHVILELLEKSGYKNGLILNQKQIHQILTDNKQRRHPTRLPTEPDDDESGSSEESDSSDSDDSTDDDSSYEEASTGHCRHRRELRIQVISEDETGSEESESDSDDSSDESTTGTISEEYTVDSETESV